MAAKVNQLVTDLINQGRWDEAHSVLSRHASQVPNDPGAQYELGVLCFNMGKFEQAERHLKTSLSLTADNAEAHYQLGLTLLKEDRPEEAMPAFREACERKPNFAAGHLHWGLALSQMGGYRGALGQYNQAIKLNPHLSVPYYQAGVAAYQLGQYLEAANYFQKAADLDPSLAQAFNGLGVSQLCLGRYNEAIQSFAIAWQLDNRMVAAKRNWAQALSSLGQWEEAIKHYQDVTLLDSRALGAKELALVYNDWAVNLFKQNRLDDASEKLVHAVDVDPALIDAKLNLGMIRMAMKEYELAAKAFEQALSDKPDLREAIMCCAGCYLFLSRFQEALEKLGQLQNKEWRSAEVDLWMGYCQLALERTEVAERHFERAFEADPTNYLALDAWGCCLALAGKHEEAIAKFAHCLKVYNDYGLANLHMAKSLEKTGNTDLAKHEYQEALEKDPNCLAAEKEGIEKLFQLSMFEAAMEKSLKILEIDAGDLDAKLSLAKVYQAQDRLYDAFQLLERTIKQHPDSGPAHMLLGQIHLAQGRFAEADEMFRNASLLFDFDPQLFFAWGKTLSFLGMHELALEKYKKANQLDPYDADIYESWGSALKVLGRFTEAAEVYRRAAEYI